MERNYRAPRGEIDLVMLAGDVLVFVEVRYRASGSHGGGAASVDAAKRRRLTRAAAHYLRARRVPAHVACRFDVLGVGAGGFDWVADAFEVEDDSWT